MPVYDYECADCGVFSVMRPMSECDAPCPCPACTTSAARAFVRMPGLAMMNASRRTAHATNERSRHEPLSSKKHGANCSCCGSKSASKTAVAANGAKSFPGARPWMISH